MKDHKQKLIDTIKEKYTFASFTWRGDVPDGVKMAKQTRKEIIADFSSALDTYAEEVREETIKEINKVRNLVSPIKD